MWSNSYVQSQSEYVYLLLFNKCRVSVIIIAFDMYLCFAFVILFIWLASNYNSSRTFCEWYLEHDQENTHTKREGGREGKRKKNICG